MKSLSTIAGSLVLASLFLLLSGCGHHRKHMYMDEMYDDYDEAEEQLEEIAHELEKTQEFVHRFAERIKRIEHHLERGGERGNANEVEKMQHRFREMEMHNNELRGALERARKEMAEMEQVIEELKNRK